MEELFWITSVAWAGRVQVCIFTVECECMKESKLVIIIDKLKTYYGKQIESLKLKNMPCWLKFLAHLRMLHSEFMELQIDNFFIIL